MAFIPLTRRVVRALRVPFVSLASLDPTGPALAAAVQSLRALDRRATSRNFEPFDRLESEVVRALAECLFPASPPDFPAPDPDALAATIEQRVLTLPVAQAARFRDLLVLLEFQPWVVGPRFARLTELDVDERARNLRAWQTASQPGRRAAFAAVHRMFQLARWSDPATWEPLGYPGEQETDERVAQGAE